MGVPMAELAALVSLGMTVPTVILAVAVIVKWAPSALRAWKSKERTADQWFVIGVTVGFIGALADNVYWALPWTANYLDHPAQVPLFAAGVYFNIIFRQGLGIVAAYCHLRAAELSDSRMTRFVNVLLTTSYLGAIVYCCGLIVLRWMQ